MTQRRATSVSPDRGDTLIEILISVVVIGIAATAILAGFATSIASSAVHRKLADIDTALRSFASAATYELQNQPSPEYKDCALPSSYQLIGVYPDDAPPGSQVEVFGSGFDAGKPLVVTLGTTTLTITSGSSVQAGGVVAALATLPAGLAAQATNATVSEVGGSISSSTPFTVTTGAPTTTNLASYALQLTGIQYWNGTTFAAPCTQGGNSPQLLTVSASAPNVSTSDTLSFVVINPDYVGPSPPSITSAPSTTFTTGQPGTFLVQASGTPTPNFSESGTLPGGVSFVDNFNGTATLSGTPSSGSSGSYQISITASNGVQPTATQAFTLNVGGPPTISSGNAATFTTGVTGQFTVQTQGFPTPAMSLSGTPLPTGVTFVDHGDGTGTISGMPAAGTGGTYSFTITANNGFTPSATQLFTLTVDQAPAITSANTATFTAGVPGTFTVTYTGFPTPALTESGSLPGGVMFKDNGNGTGTLSGTPSATSGGSYALTLTANNGIGSQATQSFTLIVNQAPSITSAGATTFVIGTSNSFAVTTSGFPFPTITCAGLPQGVTCTNNGNGTATISGTNPAASGIYTVTITASNGIGSAASQKFQLTVDQIPAITSANTSKQAPSASVNFLVTTTGYPTASLTESGTMGAGFKFTDNKNGTASITGTTPSNRGSFKITIMATNSAGSASQSFTMSW